MLGMGNKNLKSFSKAVCLKDISIERRPMNGTKYNLVLSGCKLTPFQG
jgi:hypothetical protein